MTMWNIFIFGASAHLNYMTNCATPVIHVWCFHVYYMCTWPTVPHL